MVNSKSEPFSCKGRKKRAWQKNTDFWCSRNKKSNYDLYHKYIHSGDMGIMRACLNNIPACPEVISYLSLFFYDDAGSLGDGEGQQWSLGGGQDKVGVSLDHRAQVLPLWLAAVVHSYLI